MNCKIVSGLEVAALEGNEFLKLTGAYTQEFMPEEIKILIGINNLKALEPMEVVRIANYGLYAVHYFARLDGQWSTHRKQWRDC